ncbi:hypothetical protein DMUE_6347, partial [Dictyocoela muelleri]
MFHTRRFDSTIYLDHLQIVCNTFVLIELMIDIHHKSISQNIFFFKTTKPFSPFCQKKQFANLIMDIQLMDDQYVKHNEYQIIVVESTKNKHPNLLKITFFSNSIKLSL